MKGKTKKDRWTTGSLNRSNKIWNSISLSLRGLRLGSKPVSAFGYHNYLKAESDYWKGTFGIDDKTKTKIENQIVDYSQRDITNGLFNLRSFTMAGRIVPWFYLDLIDKRKGRDEPSSLIHFHPPWVLDAFTGKNPNSKLNDKLGKIRTELESKFVSNKKIIQFGEEVFKLYQHEQEKEKLAEDAKEKQEEQKQKQEGGNQGNQDTDQEKGQGEEVDVDYKGNINFGDDQDSDTDSKEQESEQDQSDTAQKPNAKDTEQESESEDGNEDSEYKPCSNEDSFSNLMQDNEETLRESISEELDFSERSEIAELSSLVQGAKDLMQKFSAQEKVASDLMQGLGERVIIKESGRKAIIKCTNNEDKELAKKLRKALVVRQKLETNLDIAGNVVDIQQYIKSKYQLNTEVFKQPQLKRGAKVIFSGDVSGSMSSYVGLQKKVFAILGKTFKNLIDFDQVWFTTRGNIIEIVRGDEIPPDGMTPILYSTHFLLNQLRVDGYLKSIMIVFTDLGENCCYKEKQNKLFNDLVVKAGRNRCQVIFAVPEDAYDYAYKDWEYRKKTTIKDVSFIDWFKFPVIKISMNKQDQLLKSLLVLIRQFRLV